MKINCVSIFGKSAKEKISRSILIFVYVYSKKYLAPVQLNDFCHIQRSLYLMQVKKNTKVKVQYRPELGTGTVLQVAETSEDDYNVDVINPSDY